MKISWTLSIELNQGTLAVKFKIIDFVHLQIIFATFISAEQKLKAKTGLLVEWV